MQDVFAARVLLVDDQPELLALVSGSLRQAGYRTVDTAAGCAEARACFAAHRPDVMILDINLPDGDGFSLFQELHRQADIPALFLSARDADADRLFGLGLGNCESSPLSFLTSPFYIANACLRYNWFTSSMIMLETGLIGTLLYLSFFVVIFFSAFYQLHKGIGNPLLCQMAMVLAPMCLVLFLFDSSLRTEPAYMMYFALALPFVKSQDK